MSARTGNSIKTVVPKSFVANTRIELELGGANRQVLLITSLAWPPVRSGRQGWAIVANQAST